MTMTQTSLYTGSSPSRYAERCSFGSERGCLQSEPPTETEVLALLLPVSWDAFRTRFLQDYTLATSETFRIKQLQLKGVLTVLFSG